MSIEAKLARAMSELDESGVLVLRDFELGTTRVEVIDVERVGRSWRISRISRISRSYNDPDDNAVWVVSHRADVEDEISSWLKCQEQLDYI